MTFFKIYHQKISQKASNTEFIKKIQEPKKDKVNCLHYEILTF